MQLRRALSFSYLEKYGSYVIALASTVVISRLLSPADIGVFAVGTAIVGVVAVVRELGISTYIVQEEALTADRLAAAFGLAVLVGVALSLVVLAGSLPAGRFYGDGRVTEVMAVLAISFVLMPVGSISQAMLSRELQFGTLAWIRLLYAGVQGVAGVGLALAGFGPVSLAWASVAAAFVNAVVSFAAHPHSFALSLRGDALRRVLSVGGPATVIAIVDDILASLPELILGKLQGLGAAGLFSRARGLSQMAHQLLARAAGPVFFAAFAARRREGVDPSPLYFRATVCISTLGWALLGTIAVLAAPLVALLFGPAWQEAVPLVRWLCLAGAVALLTSGANHLLQASGNVSEAMWAKIASLPPHVVCLAVGAQFGGEAMAIGLVVSTIVAGVILAIAVERRVGVGFATQLAPLWHGLPVALSAMIGSAPALALGSSSPAVSAIALAVGGLGGAVLAMIALAASRKHPLREELWGALRQFRRRNV